MAGNFILAVAIYMGIEAVVSTVRGLAGHSETRGPINFMTVALLATIFAGFAFFVRFH